MSNLFSRLSLRGNIVTAAIAAFLLAACGGGGNKAGDPDSSAEADFVVDTFGDLSVCTDKREGATAYVKDEEKDYICTDGDWAIDIDADTRKKSSSSKDEAKSSSSSCEDCKDDAISDSGKDNVKSSSSVCEDSSSSSRHCEDCKDEAISSSIDDVKSSSSSVTLATPCKTETEDNCEYGELVDNRDGQTYKTVKIGDQVWMAENLNFETENSWCGGGKGSTEGDCSKYGRFYTWAVAIDSAKLYKDESIDCGYHKTCALPAKVQGICPPGWHLPDTTEWYKLFTAVGDDGFVGKKLKSQTGWYGDRNGTDAYGFSALPAGKTRNGEFDLEGSGTIFWGVSEFNGDYVHGMALYYNAMGSCGQIAYKSYAYSVRCIQD